MNFFLSFVCLCQYSLTDGIRAQDTPSQAAAEVTGSDLPTRKTNNIQSSLMSAQQRPVFSVVLVNFEGFLCACANRLIPEASRGEAATVSVSTFAGSPPFLSLSETSLGPQRVEIWNSGFESASHIF